MTETRFNSPFGGFSLQRRPRRKRELLRAWDAADEYLLNWLAGQNLPLGDMNILVANDSFGALSIALHEYAPISWSDSWLAHQACKDNLVNNNLADDAVIYLDSLSVPARPVDLALIKVPKTLALLEQQLIMLKPQLSLTSRVVVAAMVKNLPASVWALLEKTIGHCQTERAFKKARLIKASPDINLVIPASTYPLRWPLQDTRFEITNHANVFSREKLDLGARFLLQHLAQTEGELDIIDLGCGNGVLGLLAASQNSQARLHFVDESYMAIASSRVNVRQLADYEKRCHFYCCDGLNDFTAHSMDLILCNPPFHQGHSVGDTVALAMFRQAARVLRADGALWVVGNRHLGYHKTLNRWFNQVVLVASNAKFVILQATSPKKAKQP